MSAGPRVTLLIDADNVSADVMEQAVTRVQAAHGAVHVRRAYCTAEGALQHLKLFKALSIRPIVNVSSGKNCTDIALAVDAIDLVLAERPDIVVIVSSDSDFAPLVIRLREKGCRVEGIGQEGKTGEASKPVYDAFVDLPARKPAAEPAPRSRARAGSSRRATKTAAAPPAVAPPPMPEPTPRALPRAARRAQSPQSPLAVHVTSPMSELVEPPAKKTPARRTRRRAGAEPVALPEDVAQILAAMPSMRDGAELPLNTVAEALREAGLVAKNGSSTKLLRKHPEFFVLAPERQPNRVQYRAPNGG